MRFHKCFLTILICIVISIMPIVAFAEESSTGLGVSQTKTPTETTTAEETTLAIVKSPVVRSIPSDNTFYCDNAHLISDQILNYLTGLARNSNYDYYFIFRELTNSTEYSYYVICSNKTYGTSSTITLESAYIQEFRYHPSQYQVSAYYTLSSDTRSNVYINLNNGICYSNLSDSIFGVSNPYYDINIMWVKRVVMIIAVLICIYVMFIFIKKRWYV